MATAEGCHSEIEGRIVHQYQYVGSVVQQGLLGNTEIASHLAYVAQYSRKAHKRHMAIVLMQMALGGNHSVTAKSCTFGLWIQVADLLDELCRVYVTGGFACYDEISGHQLSALSLLREHDYLEHITGIDQLFECLLNCFGRDSLHSSLVVTYLVVSVHVVQIEC